MRCPSCAADLPADARFCIECGVILDRATTGPTVALETQAAGISCAACGAGNPAHALFCVRCGRPIGEAPAQAVIAAPPPATPRRRQLSAGQQRGWQGLSIAILLLGFAVLIVAKSIWPSMLIVVGLSGFAHSAGRGRIAQGLRNTLWMFGLTFLFMLPRLFFPGILVLVGLSALFEGAMRGMRRYSGGQRH